MSEFTSLVVYVAGLSVVTTLILRLMPDRSMHWLVELVYLSELLRRIMVIF